MAQTNSDPASFKCRYLQNNNSKHTEIHLYHLVPKTPTQYSSISVTKQTQSTVNNLQNTAIIDHHPISHDTASKDGNIMNGFCSLQSDNTDTNTIYNNDESDIFTNNTNDNMLYQYTEYKEQISTSRSPLNPLSASYSNSSGRDQYSSTNITPSISISYNQQQYNMNYPYQQHVIYPIKPYSITSSPSFGVNKSPSNIHIYQQQQSNMDNNTETKTLRNESFRIQRVSINEFNNTHPLDSKIGSGGDGDVRSVKNNPNIVVKIVAVSDNMEELSATLEEADILKKAGIGELKAAYFVESPNHNTLYKVYEKYDYTLCEYVSQCKQCGDIIDQYQMKNIIKSIVEETHKLHQNNYSHNDIKPHNVMMKEMLIRWKLIDFDRITKLSDAGEAIIGNRGSRGWTAPEIKTGEYWEKSNVVTRKSDIWTIGLLIIYLVRSGDIGRLQYKENGFDRWYKHCFIDNKMHLLEIEDLYKDGLIGKVLKDLLCGILEEDTQKRWNMKQVLEHKWFKMDVVGVGNGYIDNTERLNMVNNEDMKEAVVKDEYIDNGNDNMFKEISYEFDENIVTLSVIPEYEIKCGDDMNNRSYIDGKYHDIQQNMKYDDLSMVEVDGGDDKKQDDKVYDDVAEELLMDSKIYDPEKHSESNNDGELLMDSMAIELEEYNSSLILQQIESNIIGEKKGDDESRVIKKSESDNRRSDEYHIMDTRNVNNGDTEHDDKCHFIQQNMQYDGIDIGGDTKEDDNDNNNIDQELLRDSKIYNPRKVGMECEGYNSSLIMTQNTLNQSIDIKHKEIGLNIIYETKGDDISRTIKKSENDGINVLTDSDNIYIMNVRNVNDGDIDTKQDDDDSMNYEFLLNSRLIGYDESYNSMNHQATNDIFDVLEPALIANRTRDEYDMQQMIECDNDDNKENDILIHYKSLKQNIDNVYNKTLRDNGREYEYEYEYDALLKGSKPFEYENETINIDDKYKNEENENRLKEEGNEYMI